MKRIVIGGLFLFLGLILFSGVAAADPAAVFKKLQGLVGNWQGTYEWSGQRTGGGAITAKYSLTGNGTALVEDLTYEKDPVMTSIYHMDNGTLRMTHFCGAGNQPRLKAVSFDQDERTVNFDMVDITNLHDPQGGHVHAVKLVLENENKISLTFTVTKDGKESYEEIHMSRVG